MNEKVSFLTIDNKNTQYTTIPFMKPLIQQLLQGMATSNVRYCHWKSNIFLSDSLTGETDFDVLIDRRDASKFRELLFSLRFKPAMDKNGKSFPSVEHYYGLDENSGKLIHVHAYYQVITGDSLTKNYHFPLEDMLLNNTRSEQSVPVPIRSAELVIFTLRIMLKHTSIVELVLLSRYWKDVKKEIAWLLEDAQVEETLEFVQHHLPGIELKLFSDCISALANQAPLPWRILFGLKLRSQLKTYSRRSLLRVWFEGIRKFSAMFFRRITRSKKSMIFQSGGAVIAFVGSEATGKSTLISITEEWLGEHLGVEQIHVGKPKSTPLTALPNQFLPMLRSLFPNSRTTLVNAKSENPEQSTKPLEKTPLLFILRAALLAYDRNALLTRAHRKAANGAITLCDRYPSLVSGAPDSPQLPHLPTNNHPKSIRIGLARIEDKLYKKIPSPNLVIYLHAPLEVTLERNAARSKNEPVEYVKRRHARTSRLDFGDAPVQRINTDQPIEKSIMEIKQAIWDII